MGLARAGGGHAPDKERVLPLQGVSRGNRLRHEPWARPQPDGTSCDARLRPQRSEPLFITGSSGTGKSFLACALGHEACKRGIRTLYANASKLLGQLKAAKVKNNLESELKKIERCQLLILDDLFLVPLDAKERPILLDIIEDRHERKSIIITSQYPSSSWYDMVGDPTVADAILDRIVHSAHTIELTGESMRKLKARKA